MLRISDAVQEIVEQNALLQLGLQHNLLNLSKVAEFLLPEVEVRTKKPVQPSALVMQLSRLRRSEQFQEQALHDFKIDTMTAYADLCTLTYDKRAVSESELINLQTYIAKQDTFFCLSRGSQQLTFTIEQDELDWLRNNFRRKPLYQRGHISALALAFNVRYLDTSGLFYWICQPL